MPAAHQPRAGRGTTSPRAAAGRGGAHTSVMPVVMPVARRRTTPDRCSAVRCGPGVGPFADQGGRPRAAVPRGMDLPAWRRRTGRGGHGHSRSCGEGGKARPSSPAEPNSPAQEPGRTARSPTGRQAPCHTCPAPLDPSPRRSPAAGRGYGRPRVRAPAPTRRDDAAHQGARAPRGEGRTAPQARHQGTCASSLKKPPVGPSAGTVASRIAAAAPCRGVRTPWKPLRSVAV